MKRFLLLFFITLSIGAGAQVYNNEWIDYNKTYYKFVLASNGLYRISQPALAGINLQNTPVGHFQLWRNGKQVPIYTSVQTGTLGGGDYIEFWGEMNDGKPDQVMYREPDFQLSNKWSLQTDTAAYFLTVNPTGANLRLAPTANNMPSPGTTAQPYFMHTTGAYYNNKLHPGYASQVEHEYTYSSSYDAGEGWSSGDIAKDELLTYTENNLAVYTGAEAPGSTVRVNAAGNATNPRQFSVTLNSTLVLNIQMDFFEYSKQSANVATSLLSGNNANIVIKNNCTITSQPDRMVVGMVELVYPRQFNFGAASNFRFQLPATASNYLEITNFTYSGVPVLYDLTNGNRYEANLGTPGMLRFNLQSSAISRDLVLVNEDGSNIKSINVFKQRNFVNYALAANQGDFLIITHPSLLNGSAGSHPVDDYKAYRRSAVGGGYSVNVYMIDELIDQFGLGIKKHPLSVRNFIRWAKATYSRPIKDVLLIGKGIEYIQYRSYERQPVNHQNLEALNLIPTFGSPASDNLFTALPGTNFVPLIPIGRLSVINGDEITVYLNKLKQYEQWYNYSSSIIQDKSWMKNVVHVVGARDQNTIDLLRNALDNHKQIIEDTFYGGNVHSFVKTSADAVQQLNSTRLANLFSQGISLLTYFGHSSSSTLEFNLENPMTYNNAGKYPIFNVMGCNAGNFFNFNTARFNTKETISEKYVLAPERGAIAFMASTHLGIVHYLDIYNSQQYNAMSATNYGHTLGEIKDQTIQQVAGVTAPNDFYARFQCEQYTLHGDPAIRMYTNEKPDYVIEDQLVTVNPAFISVAEPNFNMNVHFMNIGKVVNDSIVVEVRRIRPDLSFELFRRDTVRGTRFIDSIQYVIPINAARDKGLNKFTIKIDADDKVSELYETNNTITKEVFIYEDEARPTYPYNYSIVNRQGIKLAASSANAFAEVRQYLMEIDTTEKFNSSLKRGSTVTSSGGTFEFTTPLTFTDNTVYYWRVAPAAATGQPKWNTYSFVYIAGTETGFNQSHYFQHTKSTKQQIKLLENDRQWVFDSAGHNIFVKNGVFFTATQQEGDLIVSLDGEPFIRSACVGYSLIFNIIDPKSFIPVRNLTGRYQSALPCFDSRSWNFEYSYMTKESRKLIMDFMDSIPTGYYVVVRTINNNGQTAGYINEWMADDVNGTGNDLYHKLKNTGFLALDSFYRSRSMIYLYKKDDPSFIPKSRVSDGEFDVIDLSQDVMTPDSVGHIISPIFGPAKAWKTLQWRGSSDVPTDRATLKVIGIKNDGSETTLFNNINPAQQNVDVSSIDATTYRRLKLDMEAKDTSHYTPYQLDSWRLYYDPVPEGAIAPNLYLSIKDTVDVGEPVTLGIAFKNVSDVAFDSVRVKLSITDKNNVENIIPVPKQKKLQPADTIKLNVTIPTASISGRNTLYINFNPDNDQLEQYTFNNFAYRNLYVRPDSLNPLLDVTFDGTHILNGDIVSAKPDVLIKLKDEAKWMILDNENLVTVKLRYPDQVTRTIDVDGDTLIFVAAGHAPNPDNTATLNLKPWLTQDGEYELIVTGKDKSENTAGNIEYRVRFQVINKPMISNMLNYPNPFTTSTAFVFTLTGSEVPQNIRIQILTITGKVVKEITKAELGPLRIGRNITEYKWDGTDMYGDKLANGVYLYRVITNLNGKSLDKYKTESDNTDKYFNKGYGKMVLMR